VQPPDGETTGDCFAHTNVDELTIELATTQSPASMGADDRSA
jgi:hypothetical protein